MGKRTGLRRLGLSKASKAGTNNVVPPKKIRKPRKKKELGVPFIKAVRDFVSEG